MAVHNFLAHVKNIQNWRGVRIINNMHPESVISMPILLTTDTLALFDYICEDRILYENVVRNIENQNPANVLGVITIAKNRLISDGQLSSTGGNKQITRAMLYHSLEKDMLVKDISYMWGTLQGEQHHQCIHEPYAIFDEGATAPHFEMRTAEIDMRAAEARVDQMQTAHEYEVAVHRNNQVSQHTITRSPEPLDVRIDRALAQDTPRINTIDPNSIERIAEALSVEVGIIGNNANRVIHDDVVDAESSVAYYPGIGDADSE